MLFRCFIRSDKQVNSKKDLYIELNFTYRDHDRTKWPGLYSYSDMSLFCSHVHVEINLFLAHIEEQLT